MVDITIEQLQFHEHSYIILVEKGILSEEPFFTLEQCSL